MLNKEYKSFVNVFYFDLFKKGFVVLFLYLYMNDLCYFYGISCFRVLVVFL